MNTLSIYSASSIIYSLATSPIRFGSKVWTNLTGILAGHCLAGAALLGLIGCVWWVYSSRVRNETSRNSTISPPSSLVYLPHTITQSQVNKIVEILTEYFGENIEININPEQLEEVCRGTEPGNNQNELRELFGYLQKKKIIESFESLRRGHYKFTLHQEFIQTLKKPSAS